MYATLLVALKRGYWRILEATGGPGERTMSGSLKLGLAQPISHQDADLLHGDHDGDDDDGQGRHPLVLK